MSLKTKTISAGSGDILNVDGGIGSSTAVNIKDGDDTVSPIYITQTKVGIGTDATARNNALLVRREDSGNVISASRAGSDVEALYIRVDTNTPSIVSNNADLKIGFGDATGMTGGITVQNTTGNVGIGNDSPFTLLHLKSGAPKIRLEDSDGTNLYGEVAHNGGTLSLLARNGTDGDSHGEIKFLSGHTATPRLHISLTGITTLGMTNATGSATVRVANTGNATANGTGNLQFVNSSSYKSWQISAGGTPTGALAFTQSGTNGQSDFDTERMRIDDTGYVGIGTDSPNSILHLAGTPGSVAGSGIYFSGDTAIWQHASDTLTIRPDGTDIVTFTSTGVGIGTASPFDNFHIKSAEDLTGALVLESWGSDATGDHPRLRLLRAKSTGDLAVDDGMYLGDIEFCGYMGSAGDVYTNYEPGAVIRAVVDGTPSNTNEDMPCELQFLTRADGVASLSQNMTIRGDGNVGIGTTTPGVLLNVGNRLGADSEGIIRVETNNAGGASRGWDFGVASTTNSYDLGFRIQDVDMSAPALFIARDTGNVGIGTVDPDYILHLYNGDSNGLLKLENADAGGQEYIMAISDDGGTVYGSAGTFSIRDKDNNVRLAILTGGSVGIGTKSPNQKLTVEGTMSLKEQADDGADTAGYSQIWVKNTGDGILMFTDDNGTQYTVDVTAVP